MAAAACVGKAVCGGEQCVDCQATLDRGNVRAIGGRGGIPVRRYGMVPPPPDADWEIEQGDGGAPRTIAEYGGTAVLAAGLFAAAVAGYLIYLR